MLVEWLKLYLAPLMLRLGLGTIFIYHGFDKVAHGLGTTWHGDMQAGMQFLVAWGELLGGLALVFGFLSRIAAAGIMIIQFGAIALHHGHHFDARQGGFEYNFALIMMCLTVIFLGSGMLSLDRYLWRRWWSKRPEV